MSEITPRQALEEAKALCAQKDGWTQHAAARDKDGNAVQPTDDAASSFCMVGALRRVTGDVNHPAYGNAVSLLLARVRACSPWWCVTQWNDGGWRTQLQIVAAFDVAIAAAIKESP